MTKDIKLALYGQFNNDTRCEFTYPDAVNRFNPTEDDQWINYINDPRDARIFGENGTNKIYALWRNGQGNYYAIIVPNKKDPRCGYIMLTMFLGKRKTDDGKILIQTLDQLKEIVIDKEVRDKDKIANSLHPLEASLLPELVSPIGKSGRTKGFRTYSDTNQLAEIMQHIGQEEYGNYQVVMVVPAGAASPQVNNAGYHEITTPIRHRYNVIIENSTNTKVSKAIVSDGEILTITFCKGGGYDDLIRNVEIKPIGNPLYYIQDGKVYVRDPHNIPNLKFERTVTFNITGEGLNSVGQVVINNQVLYNPPYKYTLNESCRHITFKAEGYEDCSIDIDERDIVQRRVITVKMKPKEESLRRVISICGVKKEVTLLLKPTDTLYKYFKNPSKYSIEIREKEEPGGKLSNYKDNNDDENKNWGAIAKNVGIVIVFLFLLSAIGYAVISAVFPSDEITSSTGKTTEMVEDTTSLRDVKEEGVHEQPHENLDSLDVAYLKTEDIWKKSDIKLEKYQSLFDNMHEGDIDALIEHPYSSLETQNGYWSASVTLMKKIKENGETATALMKGAIVELSRNNECDLKKLRDELQDLYNNKANIQTNQQNHQDNSNNNRNRKTEGTTSGRLHS